MNISEIMRSHKAKKIKFKDLYDGDVFWYEFNKQFRDLCRKDSHLIQFTECNAVSLYDQRYARRIEDNETVEMVLLQERDGNEH